MHETDKKKKRLKFDSGDEKKKKLCLGNERNQNNAKHSCVIMRMVPGAVLDYSCPTLPPRQREATWVWQGRQHRLGTEIQTTTLSWRRSQRLLSTTFDAAHGQMRWVCKRRELGWGYETGRTLGTDYCVCVCVCVCRVDRRVSKNVNMRGSYLLLFLREFCFSDRFLTQPCCKLLGPFLFDLLELAQLRPRRRTARFVGISGG